MDNTYCWCCNEDYCEGLGIEEEFEFIDYFAEYRSTQAEMVDRFLELTNELLEKQAG